MTSVSNHPHPDSIFSASQIDTLVNPVGYPRWASSITLIGGIGPEKVKKTSLPNGASDGNRCRCVETNFAAIIRRSRPSLGKPGIKEFKKKKMKFTVELVAGHDFDRTPAPNQ